MNERLRLVAGQSQRWMDAALRDPLTLALNRRGLEAASKELFGAGRAVSVAILDLDHFKSINDRFGHATGDEVLVRTVAQLTRTMRQGDLLARTGGEEFCVLFADATAAQSERACERLVACVRDADWAALRPGLVVTVSGGDRRPPGRRRPRGGDAARRRRALSGQGRGSRPDRAGALSEARGRDGLRAGSTVGAGLSRRRRGGARRRRARPRWRSPGSRPSRGRARCACARRSSRRRGRAR